MTNINAFRNVLAQTGADAIMLTSPANRQYATGFRSSAGVVFITAEEAGFYTDFRYIEAATIAAGEHFKVEMTKAGHSYDQLINEAAERSRVSKILFEDASMSVAEFERYRDKLKAELLPAGAALGGIRASKSAGELALMRRAQEISERALDDVLGIIKPGIREVEIAAELSYRMKKYGAEGDSFDPIVVSGAKSAMPHGVPSEKEIEAGDFVTMDFGCKFEGYCSDMTRTVAVGSVTEEMRRVYEIVLEAQLAGIAAAHAGVPGRDVDSAARKVIENAGYGDYFGHGFGHSLGLEIHESPNASQSETGVLPEGAVVSAEPGIYLPGKFGVRIEDVMIMRTGGCEIITKAPKQLIIL